MMETQKKILTKVRLINWHFFENETVPIGGSTLVSGENTAGKSTLLDAIQMVLTTNTTRFNTAANERGKRTLLGYVRGKTGDVGNEYIRQNTVISNVALEFYEERFQRYFVLGVHMLSPDELSSVSTRWYCEECRLDDLSFLVNNKRPAMADEFKRNGARVRFIDSKALAKDKFKHRLGSLEDRFFDIIPKSLAFKPMDNVKDFINKFVLSEAKIDIAGLTTNIDTLSTLEETLKKAKEQLEALNRITDDFGAVQKKEAEIAVSELLLMMAQCDMQDEEITRITRKIADDAGYLEGYRDSVKDFEKEIRDIDGRITALYVKLENNESNKLAEEAQRSIDAARADIKDYTMLQEKLDADIVMLKKIVPAVQQTGTQIIAKPELELLVSAVSHNKKTPVYNALKNNIKDSRNRMYDRRAILNSQSSQLRADIAALQEKLSNLKKRKLDFPVHAERLKNLIETEMKRRGIDSPVYILAELLEVTDMQWQNAVEGYMNSQKFYIIVEPEYYDLALDIQHSHKNEILTAGLINTKKLPSDHAASVDTLAYVVKSANSFAKSYSDYILGRVIRCDDVHDLENHDIAVTKDCMLYQGYVTRFLDRKTYENPYIGQNAYRVQISNTGKELSEKTDSLSLIKTESDEINAILQMFDVFSIDNFENHMCAPEKLADARARLEKADAGLAAARKNPEYIEIRNTIDISAKEKISLEEKRDSLIHQIGKTENSIENDNARLKETENEFAERRTLLEATEKNYPASVPDAMDKYVQNRKKKAPKSIFENYSPQNKQLNNELDALVTRLKDSQMEYNHTYEQDFMPGIEGIRDYIDARSELEKVEIVKYESKLRDSRRNCEEIFRNDFLAKMRENIERARTEFNSLNKALNGLYYGEDSYHFDISFDKKKESLYRMITDEKNMDGVTLWTQAFENEYKEEMDDLFSKLTVKDDAGEKVVQEYTDYRSYLDYDITIKKKNGSTQKFSSIYGEKSGSETQIPYYVAIAASFYQLYSYGDTIRLILLDEAFDKMDDERIAPMMDFFNGLGLQVILATPPAKIEVIGEKVDMVLTAIRAGKRSIIEEYDL
jgi:uncharacterized protein YPO0396